MANIGTLSIASIFKNVRTTPKYMCTNFGALIKKDEQLYCYVAPLHLFKERMGFRYVKCEFYLSDYPK